MSDLIPSQSNEDPKVLEYKPHNELERIIKFYRKIDKEDSKRLRPTQESDIGELIEKFGKSELARIRTEEMGGFVKVEWSDSRKHLIRAIVGLSSALIFTAVPRIFTLALPSDLAKPAGLIGGAGIGIIAGEQVARLKTRRKLHENSDGVLKSLQEQQQQHPDKNFDREYYQAQINLLRLVESKHLGKLSSSEVISHFAFAGAEAIAAAYLVFTAASNPIFALIAAGASIALILTAAEAESEHVYLPKEAEALIAKYKLSLDRIANLSDEELQSTERTHRIVKYLIEGDPKGYVKSPEMAEIASDLYYSEEARWLLEQQKLASRQQCKDKYAVLNSKLEEEVVPQLEDREHRGLLPEQVRQRQVELEQTHFKNINIRKAALETQKTQELGDIEEKFSLLIRKYEEKSNEAKQQLRVAYMDWRVQQGLPEIEPEISTIISTEEIEENQSSQKRFKAIFDRLRLPLLQRAKEDE